jgi:YbbR-like protein
MKALRNFLQRDLALKSLALVLAFLVWSTYRAEPFVEIAYLVPLEFRNIPGNLEITGEIPTVVRVRVRGRSAALRQLTPADLAVSVDLKGGVAGEKVVFLTAGAIDTPPGSEVVRVTPSEIHLQLSPRQEPH